MRGRLLVIAVALVATPATAAPRSCASVTDENAPGDPSSLDIRRVEVSYGKSEFVVVLTLDTTDPSGEPARLLGYRWRASVTVAGTQHTFERRRDPGPVETYRYSADGGRMSLTASSTRTQIRWTVRRTGSLALRNPKARVCVAAETAVAGMTSDSTG